MVEAMPRPEVIHVLEKGSVLPAASKKYYSSGRMSFVWAVSTYDSITNCKWSNYQHSFDGLTLTKTIVLQKPRRPTPNHR